jgi:L-threonylcarbamoyladenylate synthase
MSNGDNNWKDAAAALKAGKLAVIPTDTIFGIVASALNQGAVEELYRVRGRNPNKACIVLCSEVADLDILRMNFSSAEKEFLKEVWPNPASIILSCPDDSMEYLHRGLKTLAIRIPADLNLRKLLQETGPLLAPSANPEGMPPSMTIDAAKDYFGARVAIYVDGKVSSEPSTLAELKNGKLNIIRQGAWKVPEKLIAGVQ